MNEEYELRYCAKEGKETRHKIYFGAGTTAHRCLSCCEKQQQKAKAAAQLQEMYGTKLTRN